MMLPVHCDVEETVYRLCVWSTEVRRLLARCKVCTGCQERWWLHAMLSCMASVHYHRSRAPLITHSGSPPAQAAEAKRARTAAPPPQPQPPAPDLAAIAAAAPEPAHAAAAAATAAALEARGSGELPARAAHAAVSAGAAWGGFPRVAGAAGGSSSGPAALGAAGPGSAAPAREAGPQTYEISPYKCGPDPWPAACPDR